jgi:hypothetical protein
MPMLKRHEVSSRRTRAARRVRLFVAADVLDAARDTTCGCRLTSGGEWIAGPRIAAGGRFGHAVPSDRHSNDERHAVRPRRCWLGVLGRGRRDDRLVVLVRAGLDEPRRAAWGWRVPRRRLSRRLRLPLDRSAMRGRCVRAASGAHRRRWRRVPRRSPERLCVSRPGDGCRRVTASRMRRGRRHVGRRLGARPALLLPVAHSKLSTE